MSEQENTPPHGLQGARALKRRSSVPFTNLAPNSVTESSATHARQEVFVSPATSLLQRDATSDDHLAQPFLPEDGLCVILKDEVTSSGYGVRRAPNGVYDLVLQNAPKEACPQCRFTLLTKGEFIGIRCSAAKGRYLQARKQGHQRLVFFSDHCGVWEQWKVLLWRQDSTAREGIIKLSSRRLPGFTWSARVSLADLSAGGRPSSSDGATDGDDAHAEEGVLDLSMRLTAGFVHRLHLGPMPAVFATWRQLAVQTRKRMGQLQKREQRWHRRWLQDSFAGWQASTAALRRRRCLLQRAKARHASRCLRAAMSAWLQHTAHQCSLHRAEVALRGNHMRRQLGSTFGAWRQHVEAERQLAAMCARISAWHAHRRLRALFAAWASLTQQEHLGRVADLGLLAALDAGQREPEDAPSAALTFPMQSRQRKSLSRLAMLEQLHQPCTTIPTQEPIPAHSNASTALECTVTSNFQAGIEALPEEWHAALEMQPAEASPAVQLSGCWTEARPGMPSAVTRSQLRAPAWRPAGSAAPAQPQSCTPAKHCVAVPLAASPHALYSQAKSRASDADGGGPHTALPACLIAGTGTFPAVRMPEVSTTSMEDLQCTRTRGVYEREETPFFTPGAALSESELLSPHGSSSAGAGRPGAAADRHSGSMQAGTPRALAAGQAQQETPCWASSNRQVMPEPVLTPTSWGGSSADAESSREGSGMHQNVKEQASHAGSDSTGSSRAHARVTDSAHSSSSSSNGGSRDTDMAEWGSSGAHPQSPDKAWSATPGIAQLQRTPSRQRAPKEMLTSAPSSVGDCTTPDMASCDQPPQAGDSVRRQAGLTLHSTASSCRAAVQGAQTAGRPRAEGLHASCSAAPSPADDNRPIPAPVLPAQPHCSADGARFSSAQPASAEHASLAGLHGSCTSARAGSWLRDSCFWEAQSGALPGQAMQSPPPCQPRMNAKPMNSAAREACLQARGPQHLSGAGGDGPGRGRSVAHGTAAGRSSCFAAWAASESATPQARLAALPSPEPELPVPSRQQIQPVPGQHATYRSVAHDIATGRSSSFAAWATADTDLPELSPSPAAQSTAGLQPCLQHDSARREPAASSSMARTSAAACCPWAVAEQGTAGSTPSPPASPELALSPALCSETPLTGQPAALAHDIPAGRSLSTAACAAAQCAALDSAAERSSFFASCVEAQAAAGSSELPPSAWQQVDGQTAVQPGASALSGSLPGLQRARSDLMRVPAATGSMAVPTPAQAFANVDHHERHGSAAGCGASCVSPAAVQGSQSRGVAQGAALSQGSLLMQSTCRKQSEAPGVADSMPSPPMQYPAQCVPVATSANAGSPTRHGHSLAGGRQESYDSLQAARHMFGGALECFSPALALRGWDGSVGKAFKAWQHVTVMQWQQRLQTAAPLIRRRRFRMLAWPFRAWAAQLDHRRHAASIHGAAAVGIAAAADLHTEWQHEQRNFLHDSFWHWQEATVWGWKQRRDMLAAVSADRLCRLLHAWRSLAAADEYAAVSAFRSAATSARHSWAFHGWRAAAREQAAAAAAFQSVSRAEMSIAVMRAWLEVAGSRAASRATVQRVLVQRRAATLAVAVKHWRLVVERSQRAAALRETVQCSLANRALRAWLQTAQRSRQLQATNQLLREAAAKTRAARAFIAWRSVQGMSHALSDLQQKHALRLAKQALHAWRAHAAHAGHLRNAAASLTALVSARLARQGFHALREHVSSCRDARARADRHRAACSRRMLGSCAAAWQSQAMAARRCIARAEGLRAQNRVRRLLAAWQQWEGATQAAAARAEAAQRYAGRRQVHLLSSVINAWRVDTELTVGRTAAALLQCLDRRAWVMQQQAMREWRAVVQHLAAARALAEGSYQTMETELLSIILSSWGKAANGAVKARAGAEAVVQLSSVQCAARTVLTAWHDEATRAGSARHIVVWMGQHRQARLIRQSFRCWRGLARLMQMARQAALQAHTARCSAQALQQCLSAQRTHHVQLQAVRAAAKAYLQSRESAAVHSIIIEWRQITTAECINREFDVQSFQVASQRQLLSCILTQWQELQRSVQAARASAGARHEALQTGTLRAAFLVWRLVSASMAGSQHVSCQSVSRAFSVRKLRALLRAWTAMCRAVTSARQSAQDLADRAQLRGVQRAFSGWRLASASLQHQRSSLLSLCIELARERRLSAAFTAWHGAARSGQRAVVEAKSLKAQWARRTLRHAFAVWRIANAALAHQQHSAAEQMLAARAQRAQRGAFLAWCQHASQMRSVHETAVVTGLAQQKRSQMALLTLTFRAWRQYVRECTVQDFAEASLTRDISLARAFHSWAAAAHSSRLHEPALYSDSRRRSMGLAESIHALNLRRTANWEELRGLPDVPEQAKRLQDELRELQERLHAVHLNAWQHVLPAPSNLQTS